MSVNLFPLARGLASYLLPLQFFSRPGSGGTFSSKYCYSVWLRHLTVLLKNRLIQDVKQLERIAEVGPGDSLGIGISALFTGASNYYCFDVIRHASVDRNLSITRELETLFSLNAEIPNGKGFETVSPALDDYSYPSFLRPLTKEYFLEKSENIQMALRGEALSSPSIDYVVPWTSASNKDVKDVDLILSQAVMEHVSDIDFAYREMYRWLKPGGVISHQIDFKTHEMTKEWNGHWFVSEGIWQILAHGRKYPMNRLPLSSHLEAIRKAGFDIRVVQSVTKENTFRTQPRMDVKFEQRDLITSGVLIQAVKI